MAEERVDLKFQAVGSDAVVRSMRDITASIGGVGKTLSTLTGPFVAATAVIAAMTAAITHVISSSALFVRQAKEMSEITGLTIGKAAGLAGAMDDLGLEVGTLQTALFKMSSEIDQGGGALQRLGISIRNADGGLKSSGDLFLEVRDRIADMSSETERATAMRELFGRGAVSLTTLFSLESEQIEKIIAENEELFDVTEKDVGMFRSMSLAVADVKDQAQKWFLDLSRALIPAIKEMATALIAAAPALGIVTVAVRALSSAILTATTIVHTFADTLSTSVHAAWTQATGDFAGAAAEWERLANRIDSRNKALAASLKDIWGVSSADRVEDAKTTDTALTQGEIALQAELSAIRASSTKDHVAAGLEILEIDRKRQSDAMRDKEQQIRFEIDSERMLHAEKVAGAQRMLGEQMRAVEDAAAKEQASEEKLAASKLAVRTKYEDDLAILNARHLAEESRLAIALEDATRERVLREAEFAETIRSTRVSMQLEMQADIDAQIRAQEELRSAKRRITEESNREIISALTRRQQQEQAISTRQINAMKSQAERVLSTISSSFVAVLSGAKTLRDTLLAVTSQFLQAILQGIIRQFAAELAIAAVLEGAKAKMAGFGAAIQTFGVSLLVAAGLVAAIAAVQRSAVSSAKGYASLAEGGIVTRETFARIGEAGPEAVIPLSRGLGAIGATNISVTITGNTISSERDLDDVAERVGDAIMRKMRTYNRA